MTEETKTTYGTRVVFVVAGLAVIVWGMHQAQSILVLLLLAAFLSVVGAPSVFRLERNHVPSVIAVLAVVLGMMGIGVAIAMLVGTSLNDFYLALPTYQERLQTEMGALLAWLEGLGFKVSRQAVTELVDPGAAMRLVAGMLSGLGTALTNVFLILLMVIFILLEASSFPLKLRTAIGNPEAAFAGFNKFTEDLKRYLEIKTLISAATGIIVAVWLSILGVDFALLWGLLAFLLNFIPNLGSIIAAVPAVLLAFIQLGLGTALLSALGYVVVNVVFGNFIEPRLMGRKVGLSTLVVFLSLVFWGTVLGPVGMLLSIPITMTLKLALEGNDDTRWIAVLLGPAIADEVSQTTGAAQEDTGGSPS